MLRLAASCATLLVIEARSSSSAPPPLSDQGSSSGGGGGSGGGSGGSPAFSVGGQISDATTGDPLPGVAMCLLSSPSTCTSSDSGGNFTLAGVTEVQGGITGSLSGYLTGIWPVTPSSNQDQWNILLRSTMAVPVRAAELTRVIATCP
jgi:hypothetical protein